MTTSMDRQRFISYCGHNIIAVFFQCVIFALSLFRQLNIKKVLVSGGSLDHRVDAQILNEGGGEKVAILALDEAGRVSTVKEERLFILLSCKSKMKLAQ